MLILTALIFYISAVRHCVETAGVPRHKNSLKQTRVKISLVRLRLAFSPETFLKPGGRELSEPATLKWAFSFMSPPSMVVSLNLHRCLLHTLTLCIIDTTVIPPTIIPSSQREQREMNLDIWRSWARLRYLLSCHPKIHMEYVSRQINIVTFAKFSLWHSALIGVKRFFAAPSILIHYTVGLMGLL